MQNETIDKLKNAGYITVTDDSQGIADKVGVPEAFPYEFVKLPDIKFDLEYPLNIPSNIKIGNIHIPDIPTNKTAVLFSKLLIKEIPNPVIYSEQNYIAANSNITLFHSQLSASFDIILYMRKESGYNVGDIVLKLISGSMPHFEELNDIYIVITQS